VRGLFFTVLLGVSLRCLFSVPSGVNDVRSRCVRVVRRFLVLSTLVMLGRFPMVVGGVGEML
jgi:hypothetical protein